MAAKGVAKIRILKGQARELNSDLLNSLCQAWNNSPMKRFVDRFNEKISCECPALEEFVSTSQPSSRYPPPEPYFSTPVHKWWKNRGLPIRNCPVTPLLQPNEIPGVHDMFVSQGEQKPFPQDEVRLTTG
jgi:hypothetical protein